MESNLGNRRLIPSASATLDHVRVDVADIEVSERFYREALGLRRVVRYELGDRVIVQMAPLGVAGGVELWQQEELAPRPHLTHHVAFKVDDVPGFVDHVRTLGYRIVDEPFRIGVETVAFIADPDHHAIELNDFRGRPDERAVAECEAHVTHFRRLSSALAGLDTGRLGAWAGHWRAWPTRNDACS